MPFVLSAEELFDVEWLAFAGIQRANALIDLGSQLAKFLDVRQQLLANLFLIRVRQIRDFRDGFFECFHHIDYYTIKLVQTHVISVKRT